MNVAIIGCGLIGHKRFSSLKENKLVLAVDVDMSKAIALAQKSPGAKTSTDWNQAMTDKDVELVIIATTNEFLAPITMAAIQNGKHVIVEKPAARNADELLPVYEEAKKRNVKVKVGFNHRYHPALLKAKELIDQGAVGELMFLRAVYGHGGRVGYDKEWRAVKEKSGGGELLDQGVHLIDLSRMFLGDFVEVDGFAHTFFWNMKVDDNGFAILKTKDKKVAWLHVSCTEWKNCFGMEIYGRTGKIHITGLGGSYGIEKLTYHKMLPQMGPPETTTFEYPAPDNSWELEFKDFMNSIKENKPINGDIKDAYEALKIVKNIYEVSNL